MRLSKNVTAPPPGSGLTVAVKVTCWPSTEGFVEDERLTVVGGPFTVTVKPPLAALPWSSRT